MFKKILIANRGNFALRILKACKEMGIKTVAIHSTTDSNSLHVLMADESVCIGGPKPSQSYLNIPSILAAAEITGADAIHPGIGFLAENVEFAKMVQTHNLTFIGPDPEHIAVMGNKIEAKRTAERLGIPVVPGYQGDDQSEEVLLVEAKKIGFPVLIKASSGGGGKGMKVSYNADDFIDTLSLCKSEAKNAFGDDIVYLEKFLLGPRHIEFQILSDGETCIHFGERDCSIQRRHQKVIEEAPSPAITAKQREHMGKIIIDAIEKLGYKSLGTLEFLYEHGEFYFIEMNTRLQVEHPVTEEIYNVDLVKAQIKVANGKKLKPMNHALVPMGHAIECRINAENPWTFMPTPGKLDNYLPPQGMGIRIESMCYTGYRISPFYDSLIAQVIVKDQTRAEAIQKMKVALDTYIINGMTSNIPLLEHILQTNAFLNGKYNINWLEKNLEMELPKQSH